MSRKRGNGEGSIFKRQRGGPWYITWYDCHCKRQRLCTKTTDKTTAQRILADKLAGAALRREGDRVAQHIPDERSQGFSSAQPRPPFPVSL